jgi:hypothetical protein
MGKDLPQTGNRHECKPQYHVYRNKTTISKNFIKDYPAIITPKKDISNDEELNALKGTNKWAAIPKHLNRYKTRQDVTLKSET